MFNRPIARRDATQYSGSMRSQSHGYRSASDADNGVKTSLRPRPWPSMASPDADEVPVRTKPWCTVVMIAMAGLFSLIQTSFTAQRYMQNPNSGMFIWMIISTFLAFMLPMILLSRNSWPEPVFWIACAIVIIFPYSPMLALEAFAALIARRSSRRRTIRASVAALTVAMLSEIRDAIQPSDASFWHAVFAKPNTGQNGVPIELLTGEPVIVITAGIVAIIETAVALLIGLHIRSRARLHEADARAEVAQHHAEHLQTDLASQQLADAIAAEAHDTLAHSLSLIALNASALQAEASKLAGSAEAQIIAEKAETIRRQSAGALDEAHAIIDMLRHPDQAWEQLTANEETSLTRESLDSLIADNRGGGLQLNTWIDIRQLSELDDDIGKIAFRAIQESLTNARRHAPAMPVSLEVTATPSEGIHIHISNPVSTIASPQPSDASQAHKPPQAEHPQDNKARGRKPQGVGLQGLAARVKTANGQCRYGLDDRHIFHVDVMLPWRN